MLLKLKEWAINMKNISEKIVKLIEDPFDGPFEGEDFSITNDGYIEVPSHLTKLAGTICRKINTSNKFDQTLVRFGVKGDVIILGFDDLENIEADYRASIGYKYDTLAEIKQDQQNRYHVYINKKRTSKVFNRLSTAKSYLTKFDKVLKQTAEPSSYEYELDD